MDIIRLRTMTFKSSFNGGVWDGVPIKTLIGMGMNERFYCVVCYYRYTTINYTSDVLEALGITEEVQIPKPGADMKMLDAWKKVNTLDDMTDQERIEFMSQIKSKYQRKAKGSLKASRKGMKKSVMAAKNMKKY